MSNAGKFYLPREKRKKEKVKTAAYCRVSTLMESQESSISAQYRHFVDCISANPEWTLAGIYLEAGVSGTGVESRPELRRLMADCRAGKVDLILTKSIFRFARNTSDCLALVRELSSLGVNIRFEKEQIDTGTMGTEFFLSVLACLAEEESRSISGNIKWSIRKRFASASTYLPSKAPYGYRKEGGMLLPKPEEAEVVRRIFREILSGYGCGAIAGMLNQEHIPSPAKRLWTHSTVRMIAQNPVYVGDMLYQKTFTDEAFRAVKNHGELDKYYVKDHHGAIVARDVYEKAKQTILRRREKYGRQDFSGEQDNIKGQQSEHGKPKYTTAAKRRTGLSGKLICGCCGSPMYRQMSGNYPTYRCYGRVRRTTECRMKGEMERSILNAFLTCLNKLAWSQKQHPEYRIMDFYIRQLRKTEQKEDYSASLRENAAALRAFLSGWKSTDREENFPAEMFSEMVEKAVVTTNDHIVFCFTCGLELCE